MSNSNATGKDNELIVETDVVIFPIEEIQEDNDNKKLIKEKTLESYVEAINGNYTDSPEKVMNK